MKALIYMFVFSFVLMISACSDESSSGQAAKPGTSATSKDATEATPSKGGVMALAGGATLPLSQRPAAACYVDGLQV